MVKGQAARLLVERVALVLEGVEVGQLGLYPGQVAGELVALAGEPLDLVGGFVGLLLQVGVG